MMAQEIPLAIPIRFLFPTIGRGVEVIETRLANRAYPGVTNMGSEAIHCVVGLVRHIARMDPNAGVHTWVGGNVQVALQIIKTGGQGDHPMHALIASSFEKLIDLTGIKAPRGEVAMAVGEVHDQFERMAATRREIFS